MKIIQIGGTFGGGGPGMTTEYVHNKLLEKGYNSFVYQALSPISPEKSKHVLLGIKGIPLWTWKIMSKFGFNISGFAKIRTRKLIRFIICEKPDIIHLRVIHHGCWDYKQLLIFLCSFNRPVVISFHDMWWITGGCYHFDDGEVKCNQYLNGCKKCSKRRNEIDCFIFQTGKHWRNKKVLLGDIEHLELIAVSSWVKDELKGSFLENRPCTVISNAVDTDIFYPVLKSKKESGRKIIIGVANYWSKLKGLNDFIKLSDLISEKYKIILVGNVPPETRSTLIQHGIDLYGQEKDRKKLAQIYSNADVFVTMSYQETFGMVIAEAASCGIRTIGYDISGLSEVISKAKGILIHPGDVDAVWNAVKQVCEGNLSLSEQELFEVRNTFSIKQLTDMHIELYEKLYKQHKNANY